MDLVDTLGGFDVHLKWICCTPEVDFVDTIVLIYGLRLILKRYFLLLTALVNPHCYVIQAEPIYISAFCCSVLYTMDFADTLGGFDVHLKWIRCTPEMDSLYT